MISSWRALLVALALAFAPLVAAQADAPALWRIAGPKANVYLFGSFHLLPPAVNWRSAAVERALEDSKVVVVEIDPAIAQDPKALAPLVAKHGVLPQGEQLAALLPPGVNAELERTARALGLSPAGLAPMRPWLAALTVSAQFILRQGFDPDAGVDRQIADWARQSGRPLVPLETAEAQLRVFADLSREQEIEMLAVALRQIREMPRMLDDILAAYRRGDTAGMARTLNPALDEAPLLRRRLMRERHERWLPQIRAMIADGRGHFVVVGAAHLVGADSLVAMLRAAGVRVEGP